MSGRLVGLLVLAAVVTVTPRAEAQERRGAQVIERVVAVVNDQAIFLSELRQRALPFLQRIEQQVPELQRGMARRQALGEVLNQMVEQILIEQIGEEMNVRVTARQIDGAIREVRGRTGLSEADFNQALAQQGMTPARYRSEIRQQLYRLNVINQRVRTRVNITEEQVRERYEMSVAQAERTTEFFAEHIFVRIPDGASEAQIDDLADRMEALRDEIASVADFERFQAEVGGSQLGWIRQGEIAENLERALLDLDAGQISDPIRGPSGFSIFLVRERRTSGGNVPTYESQRMPIYRQMLERAMREGEATFLEELRRDAVIDLRL